jgi:hypothetical protein
VCFVCWRWGCCCLGLASHDFVRRPSHWRVKDDPVARDGTFLSLARMGQGKHKQTHCYNPEPKKKNKEYLFYTDGYDWAIDGRETVELKLQRPPRGFVWIENEVGPKNMFSFFVDVLRTGLARRNKRENRC